MNKKRNAGFAVIGDVIGSRAHTDRRHMQELLQAAFDETNAVVRADQVLAPTVGDEFQAFYRDAASAVLATMRLRLELPDGLDCRFGIGRGRREGVGHAAYGEVQDGPAWWAARDAIVEAKKREQGKHKTLRTWYFTATESQVVGIEAGDDAPAQHVVNAFLLCRDHIVTDMNARQRRLLRGVMDGHTQAAVAKMEAISASAVSQALNASGAYALLAADRLWELS